MRPQPTEKEIQFILDAISEYLTVKVGLAFALQTPVCAGPHCITIYLLLPDAVTFLHNRCKSLLIPYRELCIQASLLAVITLQSAKARIPCATLLLCEFVCVSA